MSVKSMGEQVGDYLPRAHIYGLFLPQRMKPVLDPVLEWVSGSVLRVDNNRREVALTFDDGPAADTAEVLKRLKKHEAKATFFMIGSRVEQRKDVVQQVVAQGHEIGNHLWEDRPGWLYTPSQFQEALTRTQQALEDATGLKQREFLKLFRPPSMWAYPGQRRIAQEHGYRLVLGSVTPFDLKLKDPEGPQKLILRHAHPGSIIVVHDWHPEGNTLPDFTDSLLTDLSERGLRSVTVSELLAG